MTQAADSSVSVGSSSSHSHRFQFYPGVGAAGGLGRAHT